LPWNLPR